jgi:hypothetical protein
MSAWCTKTVVFAIGALRVVAASAGATVAAKNKPAKVIAINFTMSSKGLYYL